MALDSEVARSRLTESQERWLRVRAYLGDHRYDLAVAAARNYPREARVGVTPLLAPTTWIPETVIPLDMIELEYRPNAGFSGVTGTEEEARALLPVRPDGSRYGSYSEALADLAAPGLFENRSTYRLLEADLESRQRLIFGSGRYFDGLDVGEACAHEFAAAQLGEVDEQRFRAVVGDPCDPARRRTNVAISTLTIRLDRTTGEATFPLHRRGAGKVGHAGGLYQVLPVGIFQPASDEPWNTQNDFSLWRCMIREYGEELLGESKDRGADHVPIDYNSWLFAARMTRSLQSGEIRPYCLGLGVDPLTFAADLLTVAVFEAPAFDDLFGDLVADNMEGSVLAAIPFRAEVISRFVAEEPTQAAGAALLDLAWQHRRHLLG
jgi:hypothetical protein